MATVVGDRPSRFYELYIKSQRLGWDPEAIDCTRDRPDWDLIQCEYAKEEYAEQIHRLCSLFFEGEESVAKTLTPFLSAVERAQLGTDKALFLASQVYEEARHYAFFSRYFREVLGDFDTERHLVGAPKTVLVDSLSLISDRLRREEDPLRLEELLVEGVVRYMGVVEAMLARTGYGGAHEALAGREWLPGLQEGFRLIRRDEGRHVAFGIHFIREMVERRPGHAAIVEQTFQDSLPHVVATVQQFDFRHPLVEIDALVGFALDAAGQFMAAAGLRDDVEPSELESELEAGS